jgi:beta-mannosidase
MGSLHSLVAPGGSQPIRRWGKRELGGSPDRYLSVRSANGTFRSNRHFFAAIKDLSRTPVNPEVEITSAGGHELRVHLQSREYAYLVNLSVPDEVTHFDDNYFDLEPGESRTVVVTNSRRILVPDMLRVSWH